MTIPVLVEPLSAQRFRARAGEPFGWTAEGTTAAEALRNLETVIKNRVAAGAQVTNMNLPLTAPSALPVGGIFAPGDPLVEEWKQIMAENRQRSETEADAA